MEPSFCACHGWAKARAVAALPNHNILSRTTNRLPLLLSCSIYIHACMPSPNSAFWFLLVFGIADLLSVGLLSSRWWDQWGGRGGGRGPRRARRRPEAREAATGGLTSRRGLQVLSFFFPLFLFLVGCRLIFHAPINFSEVVVEETNKSLFLKWTSIVFFRLQN